MCGEPDEPERRSRGDAEGRRRGAGFARGEPGPHRRSQRVSRARRRHGHEPDDDRARGRRGRRLDVCREPAVARARRRARRAHGRARQLRRDLLADRARRRRRPRGDRVAGDRRGRDGPRAARRDRCRLPCRPAPGRGDDALRHPRACGGSGGTGAGAPGARRAPRPARAARRGSGRAHARAAAGAEGRGRRRRGRCRAARAHARRRRGRHRPADPEAQPVEEHLSFDAIHQELSRYTYCTVFLIEGKELDREALESELEQLGDSLLVVGDDDGDQGARAHRRSRRGALDRHTLGNDRPDRDREHARADASSARSACWPPFPMRRAHCPASSRSSQAKGTACSSRASRKRSARSRSSRAARR